MLFVKGDLYFQSEEAKILSSFILYFVPIKDMLIALSFTWLYLHQGIKNPENKHRLKSRVDYDILTILNPSNIEENIDEQSQKQYIRITKHI